MEIADFPWFFCLWRPLTLRNRHNPGRRASRAIAMRIVYLSPKSTRFFGAWAAAMGVFSASTMGAAILK